MHTNQRTLHFVHGFCCVNQTISVIFALTALTVHMTDLFNIGKYNTLYKYAELKTVNKKLGEHCHIQEIKRSTIVTYTVKGIIRIRANLSVKYCDQGQLEKGLAESTS